MMNKNYQSHWQIAGLSIAFVFISGCEWTIARPTQHSTQNKSAWSLMRQNPVGLVVMMRHAEAPGTGDPANFRLDDCSTQRNLSAAGRSQATRIGSAFRQNQIAIAQVLSSQWCRCLETAKLLNLGQVKPFPALNSFFQNRRTADQQTNTVRSLIRSHRTVNGVMVLVTHQVNITALTGIVPASGEMVILKAQPNGQIEVLDRLQE